MNNYKNQDFLWNDASETDKTSLSPDDVFAAWEHHHAIANTAWPIAHNTTMRHYKVPEKKLQAHVIKSWSEISEMCLYLHIPFCEKICNFCEYCVIAPEIKEKEEKEYFTWLAKELEMYRKLVGTEAKSLIWFDIGWWTPSSVDSKYIWDIMEQVSTNFHLASDMNISIETTPKIAAEDPKKIQDYHDMWIRRISMWVQSVATASIGRESTSMSWNKKATENIRKAWFDQFNVDIMYWFAGQSVEHVRNTIDHILSLDPEFVTVYRMRYKGTNVEAKAAKVDLEEVLKQYEYIKTRLAEEGYEVRNGKNTFSKMKDNDGLSDYLHNRVERATPYLGVWLGAQSYNPFNTLSYNSWAALKHTFPYLKKLSQNELPIETAHHLSREAAMAKMISVAFYSGWIHLESFKNTFGISLNEAFPAELKFVSQHWYMSYDPKYGTMQLTELGAKNYSWVIALFYNSEVKSHLLWLDENAWMKGRGKRSRPTVHKDIS